MAWYDAVEAPHADLVASITEGHEGGQFPWTVSTHGSAWCATWSETSAGTQPYRETPGPLDLGTDHPTGGEYRGLIPWVEITSATDHGSDWATIDARVEVAQIGYALIRDTGGGAFAEVRVDDLGLAGRHAFVWQYHDWGTFDEDLSADSLPLVGFPMVSDGGKAFGQVQTDMFAPSSSGRIRCHGWGNSYADAFFSGVAETAPPAGFNDSVIGAVWWCVARKVGDDAAATDLRMICGLDMLFADLGFRPGMSGRARKITAAGIAVTGTTLSAAQLTTYSSLLEGVVPGYTAPGGPPAPAAARWGYTTTQDHEQVDNPPAEACNVHVYGFGQLWPIDSDGSSSGEHDDGTTVADAIALAVTADQEPILTLATCPEVYRLAGGAGGWAGLAEAPDPDLHADLAAAYASIVDRFYADGVRRVQIWNELKGMWATAPGHVTSATDGWDMDRFLDLYNLTYAAIKADHSDVEVYGPYVPLRTRYVGHDVAHGAALIDSRDSDALAAFVAGADGFDGICFDGAFDADAWPDVIAHVRDLCPDGTPLIVSEFYNSAGTDITAEIAAAIDGALVEGDTMLWWAETAFLPASFTSTTPPPTVTGTLTFDTSPVAVGDPWEAVLNVTIGELLTGAHFHLARADVALGTVSFFGNPLPVGSSTAPSDTPAGTYSLSFTGTAVLPDSAAHMTIRLQADNLPADIVLDAILEVTAPAVEVPVTGTADMIVELNVDSGVFVLDVSELDGPDALGGSDLIGWVDISDAVNTSAIGWRRGSTRSSGPWWRQEAGTLGLKIDNNDPANNYDPNNLDGTFVTLGRSRLRPGLPIRVRLNVAAEVGGTGGGGGPTCDVFTPLYGYKQLPLVPIPTTTDLSTTVPRTVSIDPTATYSGRPGIYYYLTTSPVPAGTSYTFDVDAPYHAGAVFWIWLGDGSTGLTSFSDPVSSNGADTVVDPGYGVGRLLRIDADAHPGERTVTMTIPDDYTGTVVFATVWNLDDADTGSNVSFTLTSMCSTAPSDPPTEVTADLILWRGWVDRWDPDYTLDMVAEVLVSATDAVERLQASNDLALTTAVGAHDTAGARITRLLDRIEWPADLRDIDESDGATMAPTVMSNTTWADILLTQDSDAGFVWVARDGKVTYRRRSSISATPDITFGGEGGHDFEDTVLSFDRGQEFNQFRLTRAGGFQKVATNEASVHQDGLRTHERNDLICDNDPDVRAIANWMLFQYGELKFRIEAVTTRLLLNNDDVLDWARIGALDIGDRVRVIRPLPNLGELDQQALIRGIEWRPVEGRRAVDVVFSLQTVPATGTPFVLDSSLLDDTDILIPY